MSKFRYITSLLTVTFLVCFSFGMAQEQPKELLKDKIIQNAQLFQRNIDEAFLQIDSLLKEAVIAKDSLSELILLDRKCRYYYSKKDSNGLVTAAEQLQLKAKKYNDIQSLGMSHICFAETYSMNKFYDKAIRELEKALAVLEKGDENNPKIFFTKINALGSFANVYNDKGEPEKSVEKLLEAIRQYDKLKKPDDVQKYQYVNYANLAATYLLFDIVNAEYYALKSIGLKPKDTPDDKIMVTNYFVLGKANKESGNLQKALEYLLKSYELSEKHGEMHNAEGLYTELAEVNTLLGNKEEAKSFEIKLKEYELTALQSKYDSLHKVIDKEDEVSEPKKSKNYTVFLIIGSVAVVSGGLFLVLRRKKEDEKEEEEDNDPSEIYGSLIEMIQKDDPAFMFAFEKIFPDFSEKLLAVNPKLVKSEIEFCALLKLNLSTKKIAQLKFIEARTVQNKKHRIRKKLNISHSTDIYNWFDSL
jgi:tetratricopeptide (TPR) repeat protein